MRRAHIRVTSVAVVTAGVGAIGSLSACSQRVACAGFDASKFHGSAATWVEYESTHSMGNMFLGRYPASEVVIQEARRATPDETAMGFVAVVPIRASSSDVLYRIKPSCEFDVLLPKQQ